MIKKIILPALVGALTFFVACEVDPCKDKICGTGGACFDGECQCDTGYEKDADGQCNTEWTAKYIGSYLGFDNVTASTAGTPLGKYNLTSPAVATRKSETVINVSNFGGFASFAELTAELDGDSATNLSINYTDPAGRKFVGTASFDGTKISGNYVVTFSDNTTDTVTFEYTKQ